MRHPMNRGRGRGAGGGRGVGGGRGRGLGPDPPMDAANIEEAEEIVNQNPPRGQTRGVRAPENPADRPVALIGTSFLTGKPRGKASVLMKAAISEPWMYWKDVPTEVREHAFTQFLRYFKFPDGKEAQGRKVFMAYCATNYSKWWSTARDAAMKKAGTWPRLTEACKRHKPHWTSEAIWIAMVQKWMTDEYEKKREKARENRSRLVLNHTGGSSTFEAHGEKLKESMGGVSPTQLDVWEYTHRKNQGSGEWISEKAKQIAEDYAARMAELLRPVNEGNEEDGNPDLEDDTDDNEVPFEDNFNVWCEIAGGRNRNRVNGFGPRVKANALLGSSSPTRTNGPESTSVGSTPMEGVNEEVLNTAIEAALDRRGSAASQAIDTEVVSRMVVEAVDRTYRSQSSTPTAPTMTTEDIQNIVAAEIRKQFALIFPNMNIPQA